jgi:two-component system copper resistance phosphate regulon response regulator CusR
LRILIVEDEVKVATALKQGFEDQEYEAVVANTGEDAFFRINTEPFNVILLDIMLPGRNGLQILSGLRRQGIQTPVILLTAHDAVEARVAGLNAGADDYVVKPFAFDELSARVRALVRRGGPLNGPHLKFADLDMDIMTRKVTRGGQVIDLTAREFELLACLMRHQDEVVMRDALAQELWKDNVRGTPLNNVIDVHIARLRRKVDVGYRRKLIHTVRGIGYGLREDDEAF